MVKLKLHTVTKLINLNPPYKRISMTDAIRENTGIDISGMDENRTQEGLR